MSWLFSTKLVISTDVPYNYEVVGTVEWQSDDVINSFLEILDMEHEILKNIINNLQILKIC